jgi:ATP-dependent protease HslVU (ClpYQ) peptidase subunit
VTCIAGLVDNNIIYIGGDRGISDDSSIMSMLQPKVIIKGDWIYGYAGSLGNGQLFDFIDLPDVKKKDDVYKILRMDVVENYKSILDTHGSSKDDDSTDFVIGCLGRLFEFNTDDWGVAEITEVSIGSGGNFALGSLYSTIGNDPIERIGLAIGAAITYSPTCQGPIDILSL